MQDALRNTKILLGITGSIAAYKAAFLVRLLIKAGAEVKVVMTAAASDFITPLTLSTLSKNEVWSTVSSEGSWNNHVDLGLWADAMVIAPATATTLAKLASGLCDNMVVATYLSAKCPVFFAPAMDLDMWTHPATQQNVQKLRTYGNYLIPVGEGELASGLSGKGRMAEPEQIMDTLASHFGQGQLAGQQWLITAGPTHEALDPVRFLGNRSSGKMGIAIADAAARQGAEVHLILGPTHFRPTHDKVQLYTVTSAEQMFEQAKMLFPKIQVAVLAAAVADYRPAVFSPEKIKKKEGELNIQLVRNPDIAAHLGQHKTDDQVIVGFALESEKEEQNALHKLEKKNFDFIVLNSLKDQGAAFQHDTNKVTFILKDKTIRSFALKSKNDVALDIIHQVIKLRS